MDKNIQRSLNLYEEILKNKKVVLGEADIRGIDELVYNPVTKKGGSIGYGYDGGKKVEGITWTGHENHMHIAFTDRNVAMDVINTADSMGLTTTENPYAKKDPNKKVDPVHTDNSFHYKNFPGTPTVGQAVDISGDQNKITNLIKWIEGKYGKEVTQSTGTKQTSDQKSSNVNLSQTSTNFKTKADTDLVNIISKPIGAVLRLKESIGNNPTSQYGQIILDGSSNKEIKSPVNGVVYNRKYVSGCKNQLLIKIDKSKNILQYCGISDLKVKDGDTIKKGKVLGKMNPNESVVITLLNESYNKKYLNINDLEQEEVSKKKKNREIEYKTKREPTFKDPAMAALLNLPFLPFKDTYDKDTGKLKTKKWTNTGDADPWIADMIKAPFKKLSSVFNKEKKVFENIDRIKKLLK